MLSSPAASQDRSTVQLEKSWHGLHYLLTGSPDPGEGPLAFLLSGGEAIGDDESGLRLFTPEQVRDLDTALSAVSAEQLWQRFDPDRMTDEGVYPVIWDEPEEELREEYLEYFHAMKDLIHRANRAGNALLLSIG
jgi:hypothetical protein